MRKIAVSAVVAALCCSGLCQSHPAQFGWNERTTEKFTLSNRAKRTFPLSISSKGGSPALVEVQLTSKFPINLSVQNAHGASTGNCHHLEVTGLTATCSFRRDGIPKYILVEDANLAGLTEGAKGADALNRITLTISDYGCLKNCPDQ